MKTFTPFLIVFGFLVFSSSSIAQITEYILNKDKKNYELLQTPEELSQRKPNGKKVLTTWTGSISSDWHTTGNWSTGNLPTSSDNVSIPAGTPNDPVISVFAICQNLYLYEGASLTQNEGSYFDCYGTFDAGFGQFTMISSSSLFFRGSGNSLWWDDNQNDTYSNVRVLKAISTATMTMQNDMSCSGTFQIRIGIFEMEEFQTLTVTNSGSNAFEVLSGGKLILDSDDELVDVTGGVILRDGSELQANFNSWIYIGGDFEIESNSLYDISDFSLKMDGNSDQYIRDFDGGNRLTKLWIQKPSGTCYIANEDLNIWTRVIIEQGVLSCRSSAGSATCFDIRCGGWHTDVGEAGFDEGTGRVVFGWHTLLYSIEITGSETFYEMELWHPDAHGALVITEDVTCSAYDWTLGVLEVDPGGNFTAHDLIDNAVQGGFILHDGGTINLTNSGGLSSEYVDLKGDLLIFGGTMNVTGSLSYWPYQEDASIEMSDGVLNFNCDGILIDDDLSYALDDNITGGTIRTSGYFESNRADFTPVAGTIELHGTSDAIISQSNGSTFFNLEIDKSSKGGSPLKQSQLLVDERSGKKISNGSKSNTISLGSDLEISNDLIISSGILDSDNNNIYIGGDWTNNSGDVAFNEGTGLVVFNGSSDAFCFSEEFYHLEIDKPGATLNIGSLSVVSTVSCVDLDWTAGGYQIYEGSIFIVDDLVDDGIYGDITVKEGALLSLTQGTDDFEYVDLNGNLTIDDGEVQVYGGVDNSYWTYNGDVSITMTGDAGLYFEDVGILIGLKEPFTFNENISGGEIHTVSNFIVGRDNFTPTASHLYMNGPADATLSIATGSHLSSLHINKSTKKAGTKNYTKSPRDLKYQTSSKANHVTCISDLYMQGDFTIHNGSFSAPPEMWVCRDWVNNVGEAAFIENTGRVTFNGAVDSEIKDDEVFYDLCNQKDFDVRYLRTAENLNITVLNDLQLDQGVFYLETNNTVEIGNNVRFFEEASWWAGNASISIAGDWDNQSTAPGVYSGFRAQNSTVTFNGMTNQYLGCDYDIEEFNNLVINKTGGMGFESFSPQNNIRVTNDLTITEGNWYDSPPDNVHEFYGDINVSNNGRFTDVFGTISLMGDAPQSLINNGGGNFDVIMFNKDNSSDLVTLGGNLIFNYLNINTGDVTMLENYYLNHEAIFVEADASLTIDAGSWLVTDGGAGITVSSGGQMALNGTAAENCVVTANGGSGYYNFIVDGELGAEYTQFRYMSSNGIQINPGATLNPDHEFNNCSFTDGEAGGTFITINNDQTLIFDGVNFGLDNWGGSSNVSKTVDEGEITFTNFSGDFSGEDFDDDVFNRIHWDDGIREMSLSIILHGPYSGSGGMTTTLNNLDLIPNSQPYHTSPWNYAGTENVISIPNPNIVDWVLVEYRDSPNAATATSAAMIGQQASFLLNDGSVVDLDGISNLDFPYTINDQLYVVIYHRNHLSIMSRYEVTESGGVYSYDFSSSFGQGHGLLALRNLGGGYYGMHSCDANADGTVDEIDNTGVWHIQSGNQKYLNGDFNLDSQIDNLDKNDYWHESLGNSTNVPN